MFFIYKDKYSMRNYHLNFIMSHPVIKGTIQMGFFFSDGVLRITYRCMNYYLYPHMYVCLYI